MHTQDIIQPYSEIAQSYLKEKRVTEIIFSKGTYHVQVIDRTTQDPTWAFIQFDENSHIQDCFCSCQIEVAPSCEHLATALLKIYNGHIEPLHLRFKHSFWKHLCYSFAKNYGYDSKILSHSESQYSLKKKRNTLFSIKAKDESSQRMLKEFIELKKNDTEETSLKFSNLPKNELELWKQGRPSESFRFELSFWSDIAKWLMFLQDDNQPYQIKISTANQVPSKLKVVFSNVEATFGLPLDILTKVIPYLNTINSPIKVHETKNDPIEKILYNKSKKSLDIYPLKKGTEPTELKGTPIGDWIFHPKDGFYRIKQRKSYEKKESILSHHIDEQLENNAHFFQKYLSNTSLEIKPIVARYQIQFDEQWNLVIDLYLFEPGDLAKPHSVFFGKWIFIQDKGFFRLHETTFKQSSLFIPREKISEFVHQYRLWFNSQKGFETHLATVQTQMNYDLNSHNQLIFTTHLSSDDENSYDFGDWVYIQDQGFYTKARYSSPIGNGLTINRKDIAKFIRSNADDLETIYGFFSQKCPVEKASIKLKVDSDLQEILIEPQYHFYPEYEEKNILQFEEFCYVHGEGFFELPKNLLLPKGFRKKAKIMPHDQASFLSLQFAKIKPFISYIDPKLQVSKDLHLSLEGIDGATANLAYKSKAGAASIAKIFEALKEGNPYFFSEAGLIHLNHPRYSWINELKEDQITSEGLQLSPIDMIRIEAVDSAFAPSSSRSLINQVYVDVDLSLPSLSGFKTKLRPYQKTGLEWLWKLFNYNLSGILCDDMGLGKTHQAMALISAVKNQKESRPHPGYKMPKKKFLIVCPTSVIYHWQDKLKEFFPKLKVLTFYGLNRSLDRFQQKFDVLITSYGILRIDQKLISKYNFTLAIYDELQVAKNHRSLTYSALEKVPSKMKLGLTGTPIENRLRELKALMDLIIPSYLPNEEKFRDFFINPIERDKDNQKVIILKKMIEPFILRRKKEDVLKDLPKKIEQVSHCELSADQTKLYQFYLNQSKEKLLTDLQDSSKAIPYMHVFALLNQLKQICNHPASVDPKYKDQSSGKWDLFVELLQEARESGQKVVVFSQYLKMLDLIEEHLKINQIGFAAIRGSTKNRREQLKSFQEDPKCEVFVASLKAVGLGVDLTSASVVIHYDRWWNAARENQATDRVHRIGQQRGVQVFKMVTLNTLEETIDKIISSKGKLMEEVVGTSDQNQVKLFSRQDLIDILQSVNKDIYENS
ncbi:MAG: hypothetical protein S4CHLAM6_10180 [Chlamydiae bacterium]|nr:hypothetical protein [Chlamydiota bacterium]